MTSKLFITHRRQESTNNAHTHVVENGHVALVEEELYTFLCQAQGGFPRAKIYWSVRKEGNTSLQELGHEVFLCFVFIKMTMTILEQNHDVKIQS